MTSLPNVFSFVDLETTGINPNRDRIIEIAILKVENGKLIETYNTTVNPECYIPPEIRNLTGINEAELERSPTFAAIAGEVVRFIKGSVFVAHNARFDYGFLKNEFHRNSIKYSSKVLCTVKLSRKLFPHLPNHNLDSLIEHFSLNCPRRHRAYDDALVLIQYFGKINHIIGEKNFNRQLKTMLKTPSLPQHLEKEALENLPETPGVYIFYAKDNCVLYVGKSTNIKDRVKSHFTNDYLSTRELRIAKEVARIETIETVGELGALLKESELIKSLQPVYNRRLRRIKDVFAVYKYADRMGLFRVDIKKTRLSELEPLNIMAIYPSLNKARSALCELAKVNMLCHKLLGLESGKGACFNYQIGKCKGVCVGKELPLFHNVRFINSFSKTKIKKWPFEGAIAVKEERDNAGEFHIFDNWIYYGSTENIVAYPTQKDNLHFDWDNYKIIKQFIRKEMKNNNSNIIYPIKAREIIEEMYNL